MSLLVDRASALDLAEAQAMMREELCAEGSRT
jgi:hypothetical protein